MPSESPKVFISYSHDSIDHKQRVLALAEKLRRDGVEARIDRYVNGTPAEGWPRWIETQLEWADFVLLLCTETYYRRFLGHEQPEKGKGVDWEGALVTNEIYQDRSLTTKFVPVLLSPSDAKFIPRPLLGHTHYVLDSNENYSELLAFFVGRAGVSPGPLGPLREISQIGVEPLCFESSKEQGRLMGKLRFVPEPPPHYLPREADLAGLKQKLFAGGDPLGITGRSSTVGVQGMGGIGKTVLAAALARDSEVRREFFDGVYWLTMGQKPNLLDLQNQLLRQLTGSQETLITEQEAKDALREALEGRSALVVIDDAWTVDHADAFSVTAPPARLLITTRNNEVLVGLGAEEHRVDVLLPSDALKMLAEWVGQKSPDELPPQAAEVAKECGYLPLALAMIGAMIRSKSSSGPTSASQAWKDALTRLRRAELGAIKRAFAGYPYPHLLRAIDVGVEALEDTDRERYLDLAVFPEDQPIPEGALGVLWKLDDMDTRDSMTRLIARSLGTWATGETSLMLHDLQRDLIRKRSEKNLRGLHLRLVEGWDALPNLPDAYAWRWVGYHIVKAGREDDLRRLLLDFNYLQAKLAATDANTLIADFDYFPDSADLKLVQSAIRLSGNVLVRDQRQLASQLTGRLVDSANTVIEALLTHALEKASRPWLRPIRANLTVPGGSLIRALEGHTGSVSAVAVTPDGRCAVSASYDRTLRLWDLATGQTLRTLEGLPSIVSAVAVTPDGLRAVSGSYDRTLRLWDLSSGRALCTLKGHAGWVSAVAVTPDGRRAVSGSVDGTLRLWDLSSGETIRALEGHTNSISAVAVTPDGFCVVSGSVDRTLRLWDLESGRTLRTLEGHTDSVRAVAVTPDGRRAVSGSVDGTMQLWDLGTGQTLRPLEGHTDWVSAAAVTPDGLRVVSASSDRTLRLWDLESGQTLRTLEGHTDWVKAVVVTADGRYAVSASSDQTLRLWDLGAGQTLRTLEGRTNAVRAVAVTSDALRGVSDSSDRTPRLWDLRSGQTIRTLEGHTSSVSALAVTPDGRRAILGSSDGTLRLSDLATGQTLRTLKGHTDSVSALAVTPDGRRAVSGSVDGTLRLWDLESGKTPRTLEDCTSIVRAVAITPDGLHAVSASSDQTLRVWDLETCQTLRTLEGHTNTVSAVAVTSDGLRAVSASSDRTLRLWDLESGQTLRTLEGHTSGVWALVLTADGLRAVSASHDRTLRLWDLSSGQTIRTLEGHTDSVSALAATPDGRRAVSASYDGTLRLWDLESGKTPRTLDGHTSIVRAVAVTPNGLHAVSASDDRTLRLWDLESGEGIATFTGEDYMGICANSPDGRTIIAGDTSGRVHFLQLVEADEPRSARGGAKIPLLLLPTKIHG